MYGKLHRSLLGGAAAIAIAAASTTFAAQPVAAGGLADQPAPAPSWSGWYVGGHLGGTKSHWGGFWDPSEDPGLNFDNYLEQNGHLGGMQVGVNYDVGYSVLGMGSFVLGAEADLSAVGDLTAGDRFHTFDQSGGAGCHPGYSAQCGAKTNWLGSLRGRLGLAIDTVLVYGTLGAGWSDTEAFVGSSSSGQMFVMNETAFVWGGGIEWMVAPNLVIGAEYLGYEFDDKKTIFFDATDTVDANMKFDRLDVIRARASWKSNWGQ
jgi:outer membrane immunogenic protein